MNPFKANFSHITDKNLQTEKVVEQNLLCEMKRKRFDLLHAHFTYPSGYYAIRWAEHNHIPMVITCHGGDLPQAPGADYRFSLDKDIVPKASYVLQHAGTITVPSKHLMKSVLVAGCPAEKIRHIPNGVDINSFKNHKNKESDKGFILAMGRFDKIKGFDILLEAFYKVAQVNQKVNLVVAGYTKDEGSQEEICCLLEYVLKHKLGQRISLEAFQLGKDKIALLKNCLFFVCPSRTESFGLVTLEAMTAGKPIVAFDVGGLSEIVQSGVNGILVKPYDTDELAQAMLKLLDNPSICGEMSRESKRIASDYDWSVITQKYLDVYNNLLN
jgi:glycosyltransferase involved in cell wall biosynthesis